MTVERPRRVLVLAASMLVLLAHPPRRACAEGLDPAIQETIVGYVRDPRAYVKPLLALARSDAGASIPLGLQLIFADAFIRSGAPQEARSVLARIERTESHPLADFSRLGLGWLDCATGDLRGAREHYEQVRDTEVGRPVASVMIGLIDAAERHTGDAVRELNDAATASATPQALRPLARLGVAYARYWARDYTAAAAQFENVALMDADSVLADDAAYGAAWSRWRAGDREIAIGRLHDVAETSSHGLNPKRVTPALIDLQARALLSATLKRYQTLPLASPPDHLLALFDADGRGLARAALKRVEDGPSAVAAERGQSEHVPAPRIEESARPEPAADRPVRSTAEPSRPVRTNERDHRVAIAAFCIVGLAAWRILKRRARRR